MFMENLPLCRLVKNSRRGWNLPGTAASGKPLRESLCLPSTPENWYRADGSEVIAVNFRLPRIYKKLTSWGVK
jgi:hypothetical protein